jgi:photosystem II stability/assembly factor-like uncharacterized protein
MKTVKPGGESVLSRTHPPRRLRIALLGAAALQIAIPAAGPGTGAAGAAVTWVARGAFADREFTSLVSPPGYPCDIACTALDNGGLAVSTDCGIQFATLLPVSAHSVTAKDSNVGYVAAGGAGVLKTIDGGANWFAVNDGLPGTPDARALALHLAVPDTVYCGFYGAGVYVGAPQSGDQVVWAPMNAGLGDLRVRHLVRVRGGTFFVAATDGGIYRWEDGTWTLSDAGVLAYRMVIDAADSSRVYAAGPGGVHRSFDQGRTWVASSDGLPAGMIVNDIVRRTDVANVLYVGTRGAGVYESLDYGASWHPFGPEVPGENDARAVLCVVQTVDNLASVFAGTRRDGLFEAEYSTPATPTTWGRLKGAYR